MLSVKKVVSPVPYFDDAMLELMRWVSERYVAPLAAVIGRVSPPRVASEEATVADRADARGSGIADSAPASLLRPLLVVSQRAGARGGDRVGVGSVHPSAGARGRGVRGRGGGSDLSRRWAARDRAGAGGLAGAGHRGGDRRRVRGAGRVLDRRGQAISVPTVAGDPRRTLRRGRRYAAGRVRPGGGPGIDRRVPREPSGASRGPGALLPRARCGVGARAARGRDVRAVGAVSFIGGECAPHPAGRPVHAAVAAGRGGASGSRRAGAAAGPRAPRDAPRVHLRAVARIRDRAGVSRVRSPGSLRGLRRTAAIGRGRRDVRGVRGTRAVRALRGDGLRDPPRRRRARGGVGRIGRPRAGPARRVAGPGTSAPAGRDPRGRS